MSSENRDNEGDLIDFYVKSPVLPRASPSVQVFPEASDNLIDTELPVLEQKLQIANQSANPITDSRRTSIDVEDILITIDDDEVDVPAKVSDRFLDLCDNNLMENLEALSVLKSLDDVLNASLLEDACSIENGEEPHSTQDIEDCLKDLDNYLRALDSSTSEEFSDSSNEDELTSTRSVTTSSDVTGTDVLESCTDEESLRNRLRQMEQNYTKFLASGCINRGYVDTEPHDGERRPLSACGMASEALNRNQPGRATVAVVRRERPSLLRAIENDGSRCGPERTSGAGGDSDEDIDWSWLQDIARDVTLERRAHAAGDCCTGTVVVEPFRLAKPSSSSEPVMNEEPKEDARSSTWLRTSMRRLRHLRLPSDETPPEVATNVVEPSRLEVPQVVITTSRPVSAPSRLPPTATRNSTRSSRSRSRESRRSAVSHAPGGRARSSSASSRSRRPRSLSSSVSSLASSVDSTPSCTPASSPTQNTQEQPTSTANPRRYAFLAAGVFYGLSKHAAFSVMENKRRADKEAHRAEREAKLEAEKLAAAERDVEEIVRMFRPPPRTAPVAHQGEPKKTCKLKPPEGSQNVSHTHDLPPRIGSLGDKVRDFKYRDLNLDDKTQGDIFSESFNLKEPNEFKNNPDQPLDVGEAEGNGDPMIPSQEKKDEVDGYFIQSFPEGIPLIEPKAKTSDKYTDKYPKRKAD